MSAIASIIKYEGDNTTFIWKHPREDFNSGSQLIVHETQEAVFYMNGQALDSFGPGLHTLSTQNIPLMAKYFSLATGDQTPFHCEVYFINRTEQMAIKWGTDSKVEYVEPTYGFPIKLGASGEMSLRIDDGRKLLVKVIGTEKGITQQQVTSKFRAFLMIHFKPYLVTLIRDNKLNIFQLDEYLQAISDAMLEALQTDFRDYGLALERFFVSTIIKPEDDRNYQRFKDIHFRQYADVAEAKIRQQVGVIDQQTAAQRMVVEAEGLSQKRKIEGFSYQDERGFDVAERVASNQGVGQFTNMGIGMGMISGIGGTLGNKVGGIMQNALGQAGQGAANAETPPAVLAVSCGKCQTKLPPEAKFCLQCGAKVVPQEQSKVTCHKCGAQVPQAKFCLECGVALTLTCASCGAECAPNAKFCPECGSKTKQGGKLSDEE